MNTYSHLHTCVTHIHKSLLDFEPAGMVTSHSTFHAIAKQVTSTCWTESMSFSEQGPRGSFKNRQTQWCKSFTCASGRSLKAEC